MDWWQAASMMGTFVVTATAVTTLGWRVLEKTRQENRDAHDRIGDRIASLEVGLRSEFVKGQIGLRAEFAEFRDAVRADLAKGSEGLVGVREGLAEVRGELRGVNNSLRSLQEDFRAHVFKGNN